MNKEQERLIAAYIAGEDVAEQVLQESRKDKSFLKAVASHVAMDRLLAFEVKNDGADFFTKEIQQRLQTEQQPQPSIAPKIHDELVKKTSCNTSPFWMRWQAAIAASVMLLVSLLLWVDSPNQVEQIAQISKVVDASGPSGTLFPKQNIYSGQFKLDQGYAEMVLGNGVNLTLEAPIDLEFKSDDLVILKQGQLVARVPQQAIGFRVDTPSSEIVDLGTEFGVSVDQKGNSQVHVLDGEIKVRGSKKSQFDYLKENDARSFDQNRQMAIIKSNPQKFLRALPGQSATNPEYLHWDFDQPNDGQYASSGPGIKGQHYPATPMGLDSGPKPKVMNGQFGDALYFNGESAWLDTNFKGIGGNHPRTVAFWVKVPKDFNTNQGYGILGWGLQSYASAWQISPNPEPTNGPLGRIRIGTNGVHVVGSTDLRDNRWHHIAIVLYGGTEVNLSTHVLMYVDGQLEKTSEKSISMVNTKLDDERSMPLYIGRNIAFRKGTSIRVNKKRFFKGWLDEVFIFNTALNEKQIRSLIKHNRLPNS